MPDKLLSPEYGISKSKLEECTAQPNDVMWGKTFYAGDNAKKTGTFGFNGSATTEQVIAGRTFYANSQNLLTGVVPDYGYEPLGKSCGAYDPGGGMRLYIYLPNADTNTQHYGGKITRALSIPIDQVYNLIGNRGAWGTTINPGGSVTIPRGWHNGSGVVRANNTTPRVIAVGAYGWSSIGSPHAWLTVHQPSYFRGNLDVGNPGWAEGFAVASGWYCVWYGDTPGNPFFHYVEAGYSFGQRNSSGGQGGSILVTRIEW